MNIEEYEFSDDDIVCRNATNIDLNLDITYTEHNGYFGDGCAETTVILAKQDVIALAKHFKLDIALLKSIADELINSNQSCELILASRIHSLELDK
ncbi:MAG: hypothetical protein MJK15_03930 [Colwellia sp.]|nr:hypothetical protein [Colwellia sp.]